jgi:hypothetical protein
MLVDAILTRDILLVQGGVVFVAACYVSSTSSSTWRKACSTRGSRREVPVKLLARNIVGWRLAGLIVMGDRRAAGDP